MVGRAKLGSRLAAIAALSFIVSAALHASGYGSIAGLAEQAPAEIEPLLAVLAAALMQPEPGS